MNLWPLLFKDTKWISKEIYYIRQWGKSRNIIKIQKLKQKAKCSYYLWRLPSSLVSSHETLSFLISLFPRVINSQVLWNISSQMVLSISWDLCNPRFTFSLHHLFCALYFQAWILVRDYRLVFLVIGFSSLLSTLHITGRLIFLKSYYYHLVQLKFFLPTNNIKAKIHHWTLQTLYDFVPNKLFITTFSSLSFPIY